MWQKLELKWAQKTNDKQKNSVENVKKARGLKEITWVQEPLENLGKLELGKFDFIECRQVSSSTQIYVHYSLVMIKVDEDD